MSAPPAPRPGAHEKVRVEFSKKPQDRCSHRPRASGFTRAVLSRVPGQRAPGERGHRAGPGHQAGGEGTRRASQGHGLLAAGAAWEPELHSGRRVGTWTRTWPGSEAALLPLC